MAEQSGSARFHTSSREDHKLEFPTKWSLKHCAIGESCTEHYRCSFFHHCHRGVYSLILCCTVLKRKVFWNVSLIFATRDIHKTTNKRTLQDFPIIHAKKIFSLHTIKHCTHTQRSYCKVVSTDYIIIYSFYWWTSISAYKVHKHYQWEPCL